MPSFLDLAKPSLSGNRPDGSRNWFYAMSIFVAGLFVALLFAQPLGAQRSLGPRQGLVAPLDERDSVAEDPRRDASPI